MKTKVVHVQSLRVEYMIIKLTVKRYKKNDSVLLAVVTQSK